MKLNKKKIVITSAVRTAVGSFDGSLKKMQGHDLGAIVVKEAIKKSKLKQVLGTRAILKLSVAYHKEIKLLRKV